MVSRAAGHDSQYLAELVNAVRGARNRFDVRCLIAERGWTQQIEDQALWLIEVAEWEMKNDRMVQEA